MAEMTELNVFSCSVCLNLLTDPVTTPCGHSYCMNCIQSFWDGEDEKEFHSCPLCRQTFSPRPVLHKNTMLAVLVEELKKTGLKAADDSNAGPEDVACDFCIDRKMKALKSCLVCLVSYCGKHLQPHYESPTFLKHKLVEPTKNLHENICSRHNEVMKMFCRTDKLCICYLCPVDEHKGHDTVSAAAERNDRQRDLEVSRQKIQQRTQDREKDVEVLQGEVQASAVMRTLKRSVVVKRELSQKAKLSIYRSIYVPTLTYGHELWVVTERMRSRIQAAEMSFLRRVAGLSLRDRVRSTDIREELRVEPLLLRVERSQLRWFGHLGRMPPGRLPGEVLRACPSGRRPRGRPRTSWRDYISRLAWERLGVPPEELVEVAGGGAGGISLLRLLPPRPGPG
uniref:RING-type domain-containing protein n=1 Tax=Mola mola TaxID=94237 RepID=A0A3Q3XBL8_MOLML